MGKLKQDEIDALVEQMIEEFGPEYIDFMDPEEREKKMEEELVSILDDEYMTDAEKLDAIREYLEL